VTFPSRTQPSLLLLLLLVAVEAGASFGGGTGR
jgi:hypothetical protein